MPETIGQSKPGPQKRHWAIPHVAAVLFAILVYFVIYSMTGDSDLFLAIAMGAAGGAATWLVLRVELWWRQRD